MMQTEKVGSERNLHEDVEEADRRNGEPSALLDPDDLFEPVPAADPHHEHLERHLHRGEMPSDSDVQAERQEEGMEAEEEHE
jgi:hypothetical protein